jgi:uncharacterized Tic20 family protein
METPPTLSGPPPTPKPDSNDKLFIILCHLSVFLGVGLILPLIVFLVKKGESENVAAHAKEALNFHLSLMIYGFGSLLLCMIFIGIPLLFALALMAFVLPIVAAVKASEGNFYRYPLTLRLVT